MGRFGDGDILARTEQYALRAIKFFRFLRRKSDEVGRVIARQYLRPQRRLERTLSRPMLPKPRKTSSTSAELRSRRLKSVATG